MRENTIVIWAISHEKGKVCLSFSSSLTNLCELMPSPLTYTQRVVVSGALLDSASIQIWQNPIFCWERSTVDTAPLCGQ